jgi:hypothetical protein
VLSYIGISNYRLWPWALFSGWSSFSGFVILFFKHNSDFVLLQLFGRLLGSGGGSTWQRVDAVVAVPPVASFVPKPHMYCNSMYLSSYIRVQNGHGGQELAQKLSFPRIHSKNKKKHFFNHNQHIPQTLFLPSCGPKRHLILLPSFPTIFKSTLH